MEAEFTDHAKKRLRERRIEIVWVLEAIAFPDSSWPDPDDPELEHRLAVIPAAGYKTLRVVCTVDTEPVRVITAFFDLGIKGAP